MGGERKSDEHRIRAAARDRLCCTIGGRHARHGIWRDIERRAVDHGPAAGARERVGAHRRGFHHGASAASHIYHRNVDWRMVARLGVTGVLGAILGAWILSNIEIGAARRIVYAYLLVMGLYILWQSARIALTPRTPAGWLAPLGLLAGFLDASGGGGWGPVTTSTLIGSGHAPRQTVGSVNTTEFFVTVAAAATFLAELGASPLANLIPLVLGGVLAAPIGGLAVKHVPARALMIAVGTLIVTLSVFQLLRAFHLI